ncbi:M48 family metallopeptidase [Azotosporobacter soli]|uniref:M48 family metallopeptidase n=1 Tax=Azotosporobacter soli TaxID=3055040 RepID=UPI0031FE8012
MLKQIVSAVLVLCLTFLPLTGLLPKAEAASFGQQLLYAGVAYKLIDYQLNNINENGQKDMLRSSQKQTGVYENEAATERVKGIVGRLKTSGGVRADYAVYVNPEQDMNAFCTLGHVISINRGSLEKTNDAELAAMIAHEMGHGEGKHPVKGTMKMISVALAVDLYLTSNENNMSYILGAVADNYINNEVITMEQEWEADNLGFDYATRSGYNPGGSAALMLKMRSLYGELHKEGLVRVINPNNHPKMSDRVRNFAQRLTAYSNGHVLVNAEKTLVVNGKEWVTPTKSGEYLAGERAFLIAGNLASAFHNGVADAAYLGEDGSIYLGRQAVMTPLDGDGDAEELVSRLNLILGKNI